MNLYARQSHYKADLGLLAGEVGQDAVSLRLLERASRFLDGELGGMHFYSLTETRYLQRETDHEPTRLWLGRPLVSVTTLKLDTGQDQAYATTLVVNTDYWLWPFTRLNEPARAIDLVPTGSLASAWPTYPRGVQLVGVFGYSNETELTAATCGEAVDTSETAITLGAGGGARIDPGETLVVESEQMYVSEVLGDAITVVRGVNGTTAATHIDTTPISRRVYPADISQYVQMQAVRWAWEQHGGYDGSLASTGEAVPGRALRGMLQDIKNRYLIPAIF